jgi:transcriptional regulator with PAS, ATPase and Fis domain
MHHSTSQLLNYKNLGAVIFDKSLDIIEINPRARSILQPLGQDHLSSNLFDIFPEFIGSEGILTKIVNGEKSDFRLDYLNRIGQDQEMYYLNLFVISDDETKNGIIIVDNRTEHAIMIQQLNQQKYDLLLYKSSQGFRRQFLSESILGNSKSIQEVRQTITKLNNVPKTTVLLMGESGTGKNLVARVIHYSSMPADAPFIDINCAALPENLIESELFGYEKGAFTHAFTTRPGLFEDAEGGTIFLDEIGELPLNLQAKLLSVLETKKFRRLGSNKPVEVNTRIIAATNRELQKEVAEDRFREDLYYRLNVVSLVLPPLRMLEDDVLIIADHFLKIFNIEFKKHVKGFTEKAKKAIVAYSWPGNVRELSNALERTMIFIEKDYIDSSDLTIGEKTAHGQELDWHVPPKGVSLEDVERQLLLSALQQSEGNKSKAAKLLQLSRDTFRYRLQKFNLEE